MNWYTTREAVKAATEIESTFTSKDAVIDDCIESASREIDGLCEFLPGFFLPQVATREYDWPFRDTRSVDELPLDQYLLSLTSFTADNGNKTIDPTHLILEPSRFGPPYFKICIDRQYQDFFSNFGTSQQAIAVVGVWGYCNTTKPTSTLNGGINASVTALVMTSAALVGVGDTILIGTEAMFVTAIATNTLTVERGANGTTAATHANADPIRKYAPPADISKITRAIAINEYHMAQGGWTGQAGGGESSIELRNAALEKLIKRTINRYKMPALGRA